MTNWKFDFGNSIHSLIVDRVCSLLNEFQGFDAKGYFTLNHSLLTAMAANFTTYLVILIQFKGSEVESVMETHTIKNWNKCLKFSANMKGIF